MVVCEIGRAVRFLNRQAVPAAVIAVIRVCLRAFAALREFIRRVVRIIRLDSVPILVRPIADGIIIPRKRVDRAEIGCLPRLRRQPIRLP